MKATTKTPAEQSRGRAPGRVLIVNGTKAWCDAVSSRINRYPGLHVCGEALGEQAGLEMVQRLRPSLVLTEIVRAQDLGFIREVHRRHRRLPILVFSFRDEEAYAPLAMQAGACGYLMKGVAGSTLVKGIRKALSGRMVLSPFMHRRLGRHGQYQCKRPTRP
jgi:DNA-binding NarL/FixJ family response regulator